MRDSGAEDTSVQVTTREKDGLRRIQRRRRLLWGLLLLFLPVCLLVLVIAGTGPSEWVALTFMASFAMIALWTSFARCPRCEHLFHWRDSFVNPWSQRCGNCGLSFEVLQSPTDP